MTNTECWTTFDDMQAHHLLSDPQLCHSARTFITATGHTCRPATVETIRGNARRVWRQRYRELCGLPAHDTQPFDEDGAPIDWGFVPKDVYDWKDDAGSGLVDDEPGNIGVAFAFGLGGTVFLAGMGYLVFRFVLDLWRVIGG